MTKNYYVFIGQNATTGQPHPLTGKLSNYGHYKKFDSLKDRQVYIDQWRSNNPSEFIKAVSEKTGRQYSLGCSVRQYREYLNFLDVE